MADGNSTGPAGRLRRTLPPAPTRLSDWRLVARTVRLVLSMPAYAAVAVVTGFAGLTLFVLTQNSTVAVFALIGPLPLENRLIILQDIYPLVGSVYEPATGAVLVVLAALIGVNVAVMTYHLREHGLSLREGGSGGVGVVLGTLGAGCAACGTAILTGVLSLVGATGALTLLPLHGLEFSLAAIAVVLLSLFWLAEGMRGAEIDGCPVDLD